ncbi:hypothetical protein [Pedosphaera parvula]|uniref:GYF domain-containing protein n=1 Tax=Pedosphaera parvula (strain Ellin514) TaxID=320771 RepID=B9XJL0_PEDPL|nr:hypothetical protein [Pedosphaera parvula]EEF59886.1 hypothetical protein Cflav_PD2690 [Pedosphaera parvula Ellin514]
MYKILGTDGKEYGPVTAGQVREWIAARPSALTLAKLEGSNEWKQLSQFPEFASTLIQHRLPPAAPKKQSKGLPIVAVIALVCVGGLFFIGLLAAIAIPNFVRARKQAQTNVCKNNIQELANAMQVYAHANNEQFPSAATWSDNIKGKVASVSTFACPLALGNSCGYAFNRKLAGKKINEVNPMTVMLFESDAGWNGSGGPDQIVGRDHVPSEDSRAQHGDRIFHVVFVNGEFASMPESGLKSLRWDP